jgi:hypothetical protein
VARASEIGRQEAFRGAQHSFRGCFGSIERTVIHHPSRSFHKEILLETLLEEFEKGFKASHPEADSNTIEVLLNCIISKVLHAYAIESLPYFYS